MVWKTEASCLERCSLPRYTPPLADGSCHGYITGYSTFVQGGDSAPLDCEYVAKLAPFGPREYLSGHSCCSEGAYSSPRTLGDTIGGFVPSYSGAWSLRCEVFAEAISSILCDPNQGQFVYGVQDAHGNSANVLRVCRSSCDAVFRECGFFGADRNNFGRPVNSDGTSMCYELWGGLTYAPCDLHPEGYVCKTNLTIEVVDEDCLTIIKPSDADVEHWRDSYYYSQICELNSDENDSSTTNSAVIVGSIVGGVAACCVLACTCAYIVQHRQYEGKRKGRKQSEPRQPTHTLVGGQHSDPPQGPSSPEPELLTKAPTSVAVPISAAPQPSAPPMPASLALPVGALAPAQLSTAELSLADILKRDGSHEAVDIIRRWTAEHPEATAALRPDDVARAVSSVTFSLNRGSAAGELAAGVARSPGGTLTCQHVVATVRACPMQDADVAKAMAPYVVDQENRGVVLDEIRYSFQREDVQKCFQD